MTIIWVLDHRNHWLGVMVSFLIDSIVHVHENRSCDCFLFILSKHFDRYHSTSKKRGTRNLQLKKQKGRRWKTKPTLSLGQIWFNYILEFWHRCGLSMYDFQKSGPILMWSLYVWLGSVWFHEFFLHHKVSKYEITYF